LRRSTSMAPGGRTSPDRTARPRPPPGVEVTPNRGHAWAFVGDAALESCRSVDRLADRMFARRTWRGPPFCVPRWRGERGRGSMLTPGASGSSSPQPHRDSRGLARHHRALAVEGAVQPRHLGSSPWRWSPWSTSIIVERLSTSPGAVPRRAIWSRSLRPALVIPATAQFLARDRERRSGPSRRQARGGSPRATSSTVAAALPGGPSIRQRGPLDRRATP